MTGQSSQAPCALGSYQPQPSKSSCTLSDPGYYVDQISQVNQTGCLAEHISLRAGKVHVLLNRHYVPVTKSSTQYPCNSGLYQPNSGQTSCLYADPGHC